jgi:hypothetical protein
LKAQRNPVHCPLYGAETNRFACATGATRA